MDDQLSSAPIATFRAAASMDHWEEFNDFVERQASHYLGSGKQSYNLRLACEELVSNIIRHASDQVRQEPVALELSAYLAKREDHQPALMIRIRDDGPFFDPQIQKDRDIPTHLPAADRPIGGLGIFLVQQSVDLVDYAWIDQMNTYSLYVDLPQPSSD
jgi:serine/threonine-protein kinase RsbW